MAESGSDRRASRRRREYRRPTEDEMGLFEDHAAAVLLLLFLLFVACSLVYFRIDSAFLPDPSNTESYADRRSM